MEKTQVFKMPHKVEKTKIYREERSIQSTWGTQSTTENILHWLFSFYYPEEQGNKEWNWMTNVVYIELIKIQF